LIQPRFARQTERSGGPHSKAFSLLRGKQKARIFVYPVGKRSFSFGARPRLPRSERETFYYWGFPPPPNFMPTKLARRLNYFYLINFSKQKQPSWAAFVKFFGALF